MVLIRDAVDSDLPEITEICNALLATTTYEWTETEHTVPERLHWLDEQQANGLPVLVAVGCVVWARRTGTWWEPGLLAGAMVLATLVSTVLKAVVARPRPPDVSMVVAGVERSFSFPSGHTIGAATLVLVGGYLVWHRHHDARVLAVWAAASVLVIGTVALSRLYLGYHFLTDVLAGLSLAVAVLGVVVAVSRVHDLVVARRAAPGATGDSR